ncbi:uncharacterized protein LOC132706345 [Cylas formicarius]|uniref:uncharacterized protein LOC132706345 n=1 Tax=Cylas formicarius TaxID=197179 RepID=UPI002958A22E|nr:uncharacterized protein LOC132706345 [Cylas formicarius]
MHIMINILLILCAVSIETETTDHASRIRHKHPPNQRQLSPQKCDLICPGQPPYPLPPDFIHNCRPATTPPKPTTTTKRAPTTTSASKNVTEGGESTESNEEGSEESGETKRNRHGYRNSDSHKKTKKIDPTKTNERKHVLRRERVLIKKHIKEKIFPSERVRLDGCYVICSEAPYGNPGVPQGSVVNPGSNDPDIHYIEGGDSPIDIIYIPPVLQQPPPPPPQRPPGDFFGLPNPIPFIPNPFPQPPFLDFIPPIFQEKRNRNKVHTSKQGKSHGEPIEIHH